MMKKTFRRAAVGLLAAGAVLATMTGVQAAQPTSQIEHRDVEASSSEGTDAVASFQARHGLATTGTINDPTARAMQQASEAELRSTFRTAQDLPPAEKENARTVIGVGFGAEIPEQGIVIALMAAMQESKFVNYTDPVDHDSLGIFQQRPSTGWGTPEQLTDPAYASKLFYGVAPTSSNPGLLQIDGWESMPPGDAAQAVQRSAYPDRYAQWEGWARDFLAAEGGSVDPIP